MILDIHEVVCYTLDIDYPDDMTAEFFMEEGIPTIRGEIDERSFGTEYKIQYKKGKWRKENE